MAQDGVKTLFYWQISRSARQWIRTIVYIITAAWYVLNDWTVVLNLEQELHRLLHIRSRGSMQKSLLQIHLFSSTPHGNNIFVHHNNTVIYLTCKYTGVMRNNEYPIVLCFVCSWRYTRKTTHIRWSYIFIHNKSVTVLKNILNTYMGIKWMLLFCTINT